MNNSTAAAAVSPDIFYQFSTFGAIALLSNMIIIFTFVRNFDLLKKLPLVFGLAIGDLINGLAMIVAGSVRIVFMNNNTYGMMVHPFFCVVQHAFALFILGNQLPSVMLVIISFERFAAVYFYKWFYDTWTNKVAWLTTTMTFLSTLLSVLLSCVLVYFRPESTKISNGCNSPDVIGTTSAYNIYNYSFSIVCGTVAVFVTILAMLILIYRKRSLQQRTQHRSVNKKEWYLTKVMTLVSILDFILVVVPNVFVMLRAVFNIVLIPNLPYYSLQIICCRSALNVVIYIAFNREFRKQVLEAFGFKSNQVFSKNTATTTNHVVTKTETAFS